MRQRPKGAQPLGDRGGRQARFPHGERRGERVGHVVIPQQPQLVARQQLALTQSQPPRRRVVPAAGRPSQREQHPPPGCAARKLEGGRVVAVQHPNVARARVAEEQLLVVVVGIHRRVAVQVVRREVRQDADLRREVRAVVQLERRHFHRQPLVAIARHGDVRERPADVPGRLGREPRCAQQVRDERRRRRLAVRSGDGDAARPRPRQRPKPEVDLRHHGDARLAGGRERRRIRGHAGRHHHARGRPDLGEVVAPDVDLHAGELAQLHGRGAAVRMVRRIARVHVRPLSGEQLRGRDAALPQSHHRHDAPLPAPRVGDHRTFSVASAIAAHNTPMM